MKILIDVGHGGEQNGAVYSIMNRIIKEKNLNLIIASHLYTRMSQYFGNVHINRIHDKTLKLKKRIEEINKGRYDYCFSIHCNASKAIGANGFEIFHFPNDESEIMANMVFRSLSENLTSIFKPRATRATQTKLIITKTKPRTILVECGFMSNFDDLHKLIIPRNQMLIATSICQGFQKYLKEVKHERKNNT